MDPAEEEEILRIALELVFEDDPKPRRERDKNEGGEGGAFREDDGRANAGCG
jgi:hypothetical protein